jgi:hypothetical protein
VKRTAARVATTDEEIDAAIARANVREPFRPRAVAAAHRPSDDTIVVTFATGVQIAIPRRLLEGLQDATATQLADVEISGPGTGLHWPSLDIDHYIPGVLDGVFGTRRWMAEIGRKGGGARSRAKARAARANGAKGGRPAKNPSSTA